MNKDDRDINLSALQLTRAHLIFVIWHYSGASDIAVLSTNIAPEHWSDSESTSDWPTVLLVNEEPIIYTLPKEDWTKGSVYPSCQLFRAWTGAWQPQTSLVITVLAEIIPVRDYMSYVVTLDTSVTSTQNIQLTLRRKRRISRSPEISRSRPSARLGPSCAGYMIDVPLDGSLWLCYSLNSLRHSPTGLEAPTSFLEASDDPKQRYAWMDTGSGTIICDIRDRALVLRLD